MTRSAEMAKIIGKGSVDIHGEAGTTSSGSTGKTTNLQQGLAKCWSNFKGDTTSAINDSFNMATLTDNGTGDYTISFTNDFSNVNYSFAGISMYVGSRVGVFGSEGALTNDGFATGTFRTKTNYVGGTNGEGTPYDARHNGINFHGDLV
jgi:hypothetical protein